MRLCEAPNTPRLPPVARGFWGQDRVHPQNPDRGVRSSCSWARETLVRSHPRAHRVAHVCEPETWFRCLHGDALGEPPSAPALSPADELPDLRHPGGLVGTNLAEDRDGPLQMDHGVAFMAGGVM